MSLTTLKTEIRGPLAVLTLHRPGKRNAIDRAMIEEIRACLREWALDPSLAVLVLSGGAEVFATGADIAELKQRGREEALQGINSTLFAELEAFVLPTVAAIEGHCLGGGMELAMACDLRVAGATATFGQPEVGLGIVPGAGALYRLPRLTGLAAAKELVFTGAVIPAARALELGIVNEVTEAGGALAKALALAERIAKQDRLAVRLAKAGFRALNPPGPGPMLEAFAQAVCFESPEKHRRMQEFLDRAAKKGAGPKKAEA